MRCPERCPSLAVAAAVNGQRGGYRSSDTRFELTEGAILTLKRHGQHGIMAIYFMSITVQLKCNAETAERMA
jgi:hypothetical protein